MRLLGVELSRYRSRQAIVLLVLLGAAMAIVLAGVTAWDTRPLTDRDRTEAAAQADLESQRPALRREVQACERDPLSYLGPDASAAECADALVPSAESYYPRQALDLGSVLNDYGVHLAVVLIGLLLVAASTFVGADWASGSMVNQVLFEPRRVRLWTAKAGAVALSSAAVALVVLGGFWLALWLVARARGIDVPDRDVQQVLWHLLRAAVLAAAGAVGAMALTMAFRHTVATLALLFVIAVGGEIAVNLLPVDGAGRWSVGNNVFGWLDPRHRYFDASIDCVPGERCRVIETMTHLEAGLYLGVLLVIAVVVSVLWFRRRDV